MLFRMLCQTTNTYPTKNALILGNQRITYHNLLLQVKNVKHKLLSLGVKEQDCAALVLPNSLEFVSCFYALSSLHAISLLLDPHSKAAELKSLFLANDIKFVITNAEYGTSCKKAIHEIGKKIFCIVIDELVEQEIIAVPDLSEGFSHASASEVAAYEGPVIYQYSSGSTGRSKKVCRTQQNLVRETEMGTRAMRMTASDNVLCAIPLFHAFGFGRCMLASLATGATLVIMEQVKDGLNRPVPVVLQTLPMLELIRQERITMLPSSPYLFGVLAETPDTVHTDLSSLRLCLTAGNFLPAETFQRFKKRFGIPLRSAYGSTETGSIAINMEKDSDVQHDCVGVPLAGVEVKITDDTMAELSTGQVGEIAVKSGSVTSGYVNMPELNAKAFRDGFFLTGDLGRKDEQGRLYVTGRKKVFIDSGGEKVDPQEVEQVLSAHPAVKEVAVVGVPGPYGGEAIKAVIIPREALTEADVLSFCRERLTDYKIPRFVVFREALPRSPLGKLLRKHLIEEPDDASSDGASKSLVEKVGRGTAVRIRKTLYVKAFWDQFQGW